MAQNMAAAEWADKPKPSAWRFCHLKSLTRSISAENGIGWAIPLNLTPRLKTNVYPSFVQFASDGASAGCVKGLSSLLFQQWQLTFYSSGKIAWGGYSRSIHLNRPLNSLAECLLICSATGLGPWVLGSHKPSGFRKERLQVQSEGWAAARLCYCHRFNQNTPYIQSLSLLILRVGWIEQRVIFQ